MLSCLKVGAWKNWNVSHHLCDDTTSRPNVNFGSVPTTSHQNFWRTVPGGSSDLVTRVRHEIIGVGQLRRPKLQIIGSTFKVGPAERVNYWRNENAKFKSKIFVPSGMRLLSEKRKSCFLKVCFEMSTN